MFATGRLIVRPQTAKLAHNRDFLLNKMDPYCVMTVGGQTFNTSIARGMGKTPGWSDALTFNINNDQVLMIRMFDKDRLSRDDFIGECAVPLNDVYQRGTVTNWYNVTNQGRLEGSIMVSMEFMPNNMGYGQGMMSQMPMHTTNISNTYLPPMQQPMLMQQPMYTTSTYREEILGPQFINPGFGYY